MTPAATVEGIHQNISEENEMCSSDGRALVRMVSDLLTRDRCGLGDCPVGGKPLGDLWQALCLDFQAEV
jgi:hypothetical protein